MNCLLGCVWRITGKVACETRVSITTATVKRGNGFLPPDSVFRQDIPGLGRLNCGPDGGAFLM
jgi:hypothetical protein